MVRISRIPHPPLKLLWRHTPKGDDHLLGAIREHCLQGGEARIQRFRSGTYSIVENGGGWLVRPIEGSPIGTFHCIAAAVMAGDRYVDAGGGQEDDGDDFHPGAA